MIDCTRPDIKNYKLPPCCVIIRYPGDHYAGGNPWQLLTAVLGELFYLGGKATLEKIEAKGVADYRLVGAEKDSQWIKLLDQASSNITLTF